MTVLEQAQWPLPAGHGAGARAEAGTQQRPAAAQMPPSLPQKRRKNLPSLTMMPSKSLPMAAVKASTYFLSLMSARCATRPYTPAHHREGFKGRCYPVERRAAQGAHTAQRTR